MSEDRRTGLAIFSFLLALYLLTFSGRFHTSDGLAMFAVADNITRSGHLDIEAIRWITDQQGGFGPDGLGYASKGLMTSVVGVPLVWIGRGVPWWGATQTALLLNPLLTALTAWLLFHFVRRWGYDRPTAMLTALTFGVATLAWPYTKTFLSEPLTGLGLLLAAYLLVRYRDTGGLQHSFGAGLALALAVLARPASAITWPAFTGLSLYYIFRRTRRADSTGSDTRHSVLPTPYSLLPSPYSLLPNIIPLLAFATPLLFGALGVLAFNVARFGDPFQGGYTGVQRFSTPLLIGVAGLTISPGRSLFLYAPALLGTFPALPRLWRQHRAETALTFAVLLSYLLFYGRWFMWHGGVAWGPRTLVPVVPLLSLLLAPLLDGLRGVGRWAFGLLAGLSVAVQMLGVTVDFDLAQQALLHTGQRLFAPITFFDPRYAQIRLQAGFLRPEHFDFAWASAGAVDPFALLLTLLILGTNGLILRRAIRRPAGRAVKIGLAATLFGTALLLARYRLAEPAPFRELTARIEQSAQPRQTIILDDPVGSEQFFNLYSGPAPILGLSEGEGELSVQARPAIARLIADGGALWVVSDGPGRDRNAIDLALREQAFYVFAETYGDRRLTLYDIPQQPMGTLTLNEPVRFGSAIQLERVEVDPRTRAGAVLPLVLRWRALDRPPEDVQVFIHLVDGTGRIWAQQDGAPDDGRRPTTTWQPGEEIADRHALLLPPDLPPGDYRLRLGLYRLPGGERLGTAQELDHLTLGPVRVIR